VGNILLLDTLVVRDPWEIISDSHTSHPLGEDNQQISKNDNIVTNEQNNFCATARIIISAICATATVQSVRLQSVICRLSEVVWRFFGFVWTIKYDFDKKKFFEPQTKNSILGSFGPKSWSPDGMDCGTDTTDGRDAQTGNRTLKRQYNQNFGSSY